MSLATSGDSFVAARMSRPAHAGYLPPREVWEDIRMKLPHASATATALTILAATIALPAPARAQTYDPSYPVCLQVYQGYVDYYFECRYRTMAQCQASASGRAAQCVVNPYYGGPNAGRSKRQKRPQPY
jgi:hypothetical protein